MTLKQLRDTIECHAPGSLIPRDWLLKQLDKITGEPVDVEAWIDAVRASEITGITIEKIRTRATTWRGMPNPPVRVTKNDPSKLRSTWLFAEEDCWKYARENDRIGPPSVRDPDVDPNDTDAIAESYLERVSL